MYEQCIEFENRVSPIKHIAEFKYYYSLGSTRQFSKVAEYFNCNAKTLRGWAYNERWAEECEELDRIIVNESKRMAVTDAIHASNKYRLLIDKAMDVFIEGLAKKKIKITSVRDLDMLMRLDIEILEKLAKGYMPEIKGIGTGDANINVNIDFIGADDGKDDQH